MYTLHTQCSFKCSMSLSMIMDYNFSYQAQVESSETVLAKFESDGLILSRDIKRGRKLAMDILEKYMKHVWSAVTNKLLSRLVRQVTLKQSNANFCTKRTL